MGIAFLKASLQAPEDLRVEEHHDQQRCHDTSQEIEVDHEGEGDDREEGARMRRVRRRIGGIRCLRGVAVPAKQRNEPQETRKYPAHSHGQTGAFLCGQRFVSENEE